MATNTPQTVTDQWSGIQDGPWSGSLQNVGNTPLVGVVRIGEDGVPDDGAGGFAIYSPAVAIDIPEGEKLWVRAVGASGVVVLS